jgi:hypothetical protein
LFLGLSGIFTGPLRVILGIMGVFCGILGKMYGPELAIGKLAEVIKTNLG